MRVRSLGGRKSIPGTASGGEELQGVVGWKVVVTPGCPTWCGPGAGKSPTLSP